MTPLPPINDFECHITTEVGFAESATAVANIAGWKTSEIKRDPVLGDGSHFYLTAHSRDYETLLRKMLTTADAMRALNIPVVRQKIEGILLDTKTHAA